MAETEMTIEAIRVSLMNYNRVVVLRDAGSDRYLPIWIGAPEADAIAVRLQGVEVPRPMTHDLLTNVLQELGGAVERVVVSSLSNDTFYARVHVRVEERALEIDARPSDAIALAVRSEAPIFVADAVLEQAGVTLDEQESEAAEGEGRPPQPPVKPEELEKMSAFKDFIEGLDLDDFDQR